MLKRPLTLLLLLALAVPALAELPASRPEEAAVVAAEQFVLVLDNGEVEQAWMATTPLFRALTDEPLWKSRQQALRTAYGALLERAFIRLEPRTNYPLSADGNFAIVQFSARFEHKNSTTETVVLRQQETGLWQVRDYVIR